MKLRRSQAHKIVAFALINFGSGALVATMLLTTINGTLAHFGKPTPIVPLTFINYFPLACFAVFAISLCVYVTRDAIKRVFLVKE